MELKKTLRSSTVSAPFIFYTTVPTLSPAAAAALAEACNAFHNNNHERIEAEFRNAASAAPDSPHILSNLGAWLCASGNPQEGVRLLHAATTMEHSCAGAWYNLGTLFLTHQLFGQAIDALTKAIALDTTSAPIYNNLAVAQFHNKQLAEAEQSLAAATHCLDAIGQSHHAELICHNRGIIALELGQLSRAHEYLIQACTLHPKSATSMNALGCVYALQGRTEEALSTFKKSLALDSTFGVAYHNIGALVIHTDMISAHAEA